MGGSKSGKTGGRGRASDIEGTDRKIAKRGGAWRRKSIGDLSCKKPPCYEKKHFEAKKIRVERTFPGWETQGNNCRKRFTRRERAGEADPEKDRNTEKRSCNGEKFEDQWRQEDRGGLRIE